jgi:serine/threonine protein kinase
MATMAAGDSMVLPSWGLLCLLVLLAGLVGAIVILRLAWRRRQDGERGPNEPAKGMPSPVATVGVPTTDFAPGGQQETRFGRYRILEHLGSGGMGTVYKAFDPHLDRVVALKLPHFYGTGAEVTKRVQRFQREAQAAAKIWHPSVCPIYDVGEEDGRPFVVMAWVDGKSLAARLTDMGRFESIGEAVSVVRNILDGLEAVHAHGVLHRDLKPGNILLDRSGRPIVTDFGLARTEASADPITSEGVIIGTPSYMAPEQAKGPEAVGPFTDIYSVGVVFYQMLTGRLPFEGTPLEVLAKLGHEQPVAPSRYRSDLPPGLERVILTALARDPAARFADTRQFRAALDGWQEGTGETSHAGMVTRDWKPASGNDTHLLSGENPPRAEATQRRTNGAELERLERAVFISRLKDLLQAHRRPAQNGGVEYIVWAACLLGACALAAWPTTGCRPRMRLRER